MTHLDDMIDKLQTPEGKRQASLRLSGDSIDVSLIQSSMSRAQYFMEVAKKHGMLGDKREERINYRQAMLAYEKAGVFSDAKNVAQILGDKEMEQVYHDIIRYVK